MGCSPWGREELDTTEWLHFHFSLSSIGEGNGNPLQCSCLENSRDGGAWWATVYGVAQSRTRLKRLSSSKLEQLLGKLGFRDFVHSLITSLISSWAPSRDLCTSWACHTEANQWGWGFPFHKVGLIPVDPYHSNTDSEGNNYRSSTGQDFLVVQWLRIFVPMQGMQVCSLVGELRSHRLQGNSALAQQLLSPRHNQGEARMPQLRPDTARNKQIFIKKNICQSLEMSQREMLCEPACCVDSLVKHVLVKLVMWSPSVCTNEHVPERRDWIWQLLYLTKTVL